MFLITPRQCVHQNAIDHPEWTVEEHAAALKDNYRVCPRTIERWLEERNA